MEDVVLYHGSKGGIKGDIKPCSRERCDFGKGFYMGSDKFQAQALVCEDFTPFLYTVKLKLSEIPQNKILTIDNNDEWLKVILACRHKIPELNNSKTIKHLLEKIQSYDIIIGKIADDKMNVALEYFEKFGLTDKGLIACLQSVNYGVQYVAKSDFACSKIEILSKQWIRGKELTDIKHRAAKQFKSDFNLVDSIAEEYYGKGKTIKQYVKSIIKEEKQKGGFGNV